ncbi:glycosyltransferase [Streptomyces macrosporus]|uniref:Glycosyltransferase n=1 Tax=Streptomyces macrosporus TaxID=44032 RepID=A0ABN3J7G9_9ACTN
MPDNERTAAPRTVLHLSQPVEGGVPRVVVDLVRAQTAAGLRTVVACPPGGTLGRDAAAAGAEVVPWQASREPGPGLYGETVRIARLVRRIGPDLVHAHSAKAGLAARLALRGRVPTVHQPHAWSFDAVGGATARLALYWERLATRWADRVLCVSEDERRHGLEAGVRAHWAVIRNGVDTDRFRPADADARARARAALPALDGLPPHALLTVCVGRLCRQKGQDVLLRAWPDVADRVPDAWLVLVGDGPQRRELGAAAPRRVLFAGAADDTVPWYAAADLVVLPSRWEGMALVPLEAMACGRPVVTTEVTGAAESLPPGHAARCLVPPEHPTALARALTGLLADPRLRHDLGRRAADHVRSAFDVRRTAAEVARLYDEVLAERSAVPPSEPPLPPATEPSAPPYLGPFPHTVDGPSVVPPLPEPSPHPLDDPSALSPHPESTERTRR